MHEQLQAKLDLDIKDAKPGKGPRKMSDMDSSLTPGSAQKARAPRDKSTGKIAKKKAKKDK